MYPNLPSDELKGFPFAFISYLENFFFLPRLCIRKIVWLLLISQVLSSWLELIEFYSRQKFLRE